MKTPELKPGDYIRRTDTHAGCNGCVLKMNEDSFKDKGDYLHLSVIRASDDWCNKFNKPSCMVYADETYEVLTPEQLMEIELSR